MHILNKQISKVPLEKMNSYNKQAGRTHEQIDDSFLERFLQNIMKWFGLEDVSNE